MIKLPNFSKACILVIGDLILDRYYRGEVKRISPEAPIPVVNVKSVEEKPGGAGNVALNVKALGGEVILLGMIGKDHEGQALKNAIKAKGVDCHFQMVEYPTITKTRVLGQTQQLVRLDYERKYHQIDWTPLFETYQKALAKADIVVLSDYAKGALQNPRLLIDAARAKGLPVLVDPKSSDFSVYEGATLVTPNLEEFKVVAGEVESDEDMARKGGELVKQHGFDALLVTRGMHGMALLQKNESPFYLKALAQEIFDVTGAGDTVIASLAASLAAGEDLKTSVTLANVAASISVQKQGAACVSVFELRRALRRYYDTELGVLSEEEVIMAVQDAKAHGEKIVMTNGCFDLLHPGHVAYLEEAKAQGDRLIVAVNDDASVKRLKGASRPINPVEQRMAVLSALRVVDWVVSFNEDTPERLIKAIQPDVLAKGGDYQVHEIAGADFVQSQGGIVKILQFDERCSTTKMLEKIKGRGET